jgi:putative ABC transport system permease protein
MSINISYLYLGLGATLLLIPILIMAYLKLNLIKNLIFSILRVVLQLALVGIFLKYIFEWNNLIINILWLLLIILAGSFTISSRSEIPKHILLKPVIIGFTSAFLISTFFISQLFFFEHDYFNAMYLIPISGMLIGNSLSTSIVGIRSLFKDLKVKKDLTEYYLVNGLTIKESTINSIKSALNDSFKPMLGNISTIGLIWLPGTMTGQIIAGSSPIQAVKFQFLIVIGYFSTCFIATVITLYLSRNNAYDDFGRLKNIK